MKFPELPQWICARQISRRMSKKKAKGYKKRANRKYLLGRTYKDYKIYTGKNPNVFVTQMDTVYNDETNGPFIQTFKFINSGLIFAILHNSKTAESMKQGIDLLESILGAQVFRKYVHILLTDRGSEFSQLMLWKPVQITQDVQEYFTVIQCSPDRKAPWRTNTSS